MKDRYRVTMLINDTIFLESFDRLNNAVAFYMFAVGRVQSKAMLYDDYICKVLWSNGKLGDVRKHKEG